jgi:hypothetical protein
VWVFGGGLYEQVNLVDNVREFLPDPAVATDRVRRRSRLGQGSAMTPKRVSGVSRFALPVR